MPGRPWEGPTPGSHPRAPHLLCPCCPGLRPGWARARARDGEIGTQGHLNHLPRASSLPLHWPEARPPTPVWPHFPSWYPHRGPRSTQGVVSVAHVCPPTPTAPRRAAVLPIRLGRGRRTFPRRRSEPTEPGPPGPSGASALISATCPVCPALSA